MPRPRLGSLGLALPGPDTRFWRTVVSFLMPFEIWFCLFLFAGIFKENPRLAWLPVDLTLLAFLLSIVSGAWRLLDRRPRVPWRVVPPMIAMIAFCLWAAFSLLWSPAPIYGGSKALYLGIFGTWSLFGGAVVMGGSTRALCRFMWTVVVLSLWVSIEVGWLVLSGDLIRELEWGNQYLGLGRLVGLGILGLVSVVLWQRVPFFGFMFILVGVGLLMIALLVFGGRGPFLATLVALGVPLVTEIRVSDGSLRIRKPLLILITFCFGLLCYFYFVGNLYFNTTTLDRFRLLLEAGGEGSANIRFWFFGHAWDQWMTNPIVGGGIGSFSYHLGWRDMVVYPHNIVLEVMAELGVVGLALLSLVFAATLKWMSPRSIRKDIVLALGVMLLLNTVINAMVTGDLASNRVMFAMLGVAAGLAAKRNDGGATV